MKELSIEEKAKRYDEAIEKAKAWCDCENATTDDKILLKRILPELAESEDERIRKELLNHLKEASYGKTLVVSTLDYKRWADWLEKQDKKDEEILVLKDQIESLHAAIKAIKETHRVELEKQGEQRSDCGISSTTKQKLKDNLNKALQKETGESWNEFLDEQKPTDKVEPKFKDGDWIVYNNNLYHIGNISLQRYYECLRVDGTVHTFSLDIDSKSHLWTIEDAKDGDVLAIDPWSDYPSSFVTIYKKQNEEDFDSYCFVGFDGKFYKGENGHSTEDIHPATKEQRDTLMKAMNDAGYTFDFEKKELRKIENEIEIPFGAKDSELQEATYYIPKGFHAEIEDNKVAIKKGEQKPAWSEEELDSITAAINNLEYLKNNYVYHQMGLEPAITFLKSLKDRVQPKQEWSEEDEYHKRQILRILKDNGCSQTLQEKTEKWIEERLKSLRPQNTWKPSDEQMNALVQASITGVPGHKEALESLINDLKKLMEE